MKAKIKLFTTICLINLLSPGCEAKTENQRQVSSANPPVNITNTQATAQTMSPSATPNTDETKSPTRPPAASPSPSPSTAPVITEGGLNQPVELKVNDTVRISSENLTIKFSGIEDSRCPSGAQCIWAGEFKAKLEVTVSGKSQEKAELNMLPGEKVIPEQKVGNYTIKLEKVISPTTKAPVGKTSGVYRISIIIIKN